MDFDELSFTTQVGNDPQTVTQIVRYIKSSIILTQSYSRRIDWRSITVVSRRIGRSRESTNVDKRSLHVCCWSRRAWSNWRLTGWRKTKDPNLVLKTSRDIERVGAVLVRLMIKNNAHIYTLRRREINVLHHSWSWLCVEVNNA